MDSTTTPSLVVKVSYGGVLRRFRVPFKANGQLDLAMAGLREKIALLFNLPVDAEFSLTYSDEDGDVVALVDDNDLFDATNQRLKFLKINVQSNSGTPTGSVASESSGASTPVGIRTGETPVSKIQQGINDVMRAVPHPMRDTMSKVYIDLTSKAASSSPVVGELFDCISKLGKLSITQEGTPSSSGGNQTSCGKGTKPGSSGPSVRKEVPSSSEKKPQTEENRANLNEPPAFAEVFDFISKLGKLSIPQEGSPSSPGGNLNKPTGFSELFDLISKLGKLSIPQEASSSSPVGNQTSCGEGTKPGSSGPSVRREVPSTSEKKTQTKGNLANLNEPTGFADPVIFGRVATSSGQGASFNECPFSGGPVKDAVPNPIYVNKHGRRACPKKSIIGESMGRHWKSPVLDVFHKGIRCDGCGVLPITGPRFKSKIKEDYDLCTICFSVMGNESDFTRMDKPIAVHNAHHPTGQSPQFLNPWMSHLVPRPPHGGLHFRCTRPKLDSRFVLDVNVLDGTAVAPSASFTKIWRMRNNGSLVWPQGTQIVWIGGDRFSNSLYVDLKIPEGGVPINSEIDVKVDFIAPESPGRYISYWRMASSNGAKFGQRVWVLIHVDAALKGSVVNEFHGLNLNASPDENYSREFAGIKLNHDSAQPGCSSANPVTVTDDEVEEKGDESQIPVKEDLLVGEVHPAVPQTLTPSSSSSSYNMIEFPNMPTVEAALSGGSSSPKDIPVPLQEDVEKNDVEMVMLKELEEMGFKEIDLNKEILRDNEYNLEQSLDALCGVSEWDPILEELQEMGFCDDVTNKRLLKKNNGSIKGVVMDLLTGEKEA